MTQEALVPFAFDPCPVKATINLFVLPLKAAPSGGCRNGKDLLRKKVNSLECSRDKTAFLSLALTTVWLVSCLTLFSY